MRTALQRINGKRTTFIGTFVRFGEKDRYDEYVGGFIDTILLKM